MKRDLISEDSNQFGPGTDLVICLLALLMVMVMVVSVLYNYEKKLHDTAQQKVSELEAKFGRVEKKLFDQESEGKFKLDIGRFDNATFKQKPPDELTDTEKTKAQILDIAEKYRELGGEYPFIFVIGHANAMGKIGENLSDEQRREFNWDVAGERSAVIANLLQAQIPEAARNNIIIVSTGEFDLKNPQDPKSVENANVEVIFGKEWKIN